MLNNQATRNKYDFMEEFKVLNHSMNRRKIENFVRLCKHLDKIIILPTKQIVDKWDGKSILAFRFNREAQKYIDKSFDSTLYSIFYNADSFSTF